MLAKEILRRIRTEEEDRENPEMNFDRIVSMPKDSPIKQCKWLLDSLKEQPTFERQTFKETLTIKTPKATLNERLKTESYNNYQSVLKYALKMEEVKNFERGAKARQGKKSQVSNLKSVMGKIKIRMLLDESKEELEDVRAELLLRNNDQRQRAFDQSLLMERWLNLQRQAKMTDETNSRLPVKFRGINPKHLRLPERVYNESQFLRRKRVHNEKTFQYYQHAAKIQGSIIKTKERQNSVAIKQLMGSNLLNEQSSNAQDQKKPLGRTVNEIVHRLFLKYANGACEDVEKMYTLIKVSTMQKFFADFNIDWKENSRIVKIMSSHSELSEFLFLEILHLLSLKKDGTFYSDVKHFLKTKILPHIDKCLPLERIALEESRPLLRKLLKVTRFDQYLLDLYGMTQPKGDPNVVSFDQVVELMWQTEMYPFSVNKQQLRFYFLYTTQNCSVTLHDVGDMLVMLTLQKPGTIEAKISNLVQTMAKCTSINGQKG